MVSGQGADSIFYNKKKRLDVQNTGYPLTLPYVRKDLIFPLPPLRPPYKVDVICVSPLT